MPGLYLHIPFCRRKCPYCDFFSVNESHAHFASYPALLELHLCRAAAQDWQRPFDTVYLGGGTPTLLDPAAIGRLLETVDRQFGLAGDAEITLEGNPGTLTPASLSGYRAAGINRLSLGLQSLDANQLVGLGRLHGPREGRQSVRWARQAGFSNLSLDLIFALPGQTLATLDGDLDGYLDLAPEHLSCYGLTVEPETPFHQQLHSGHLLLPDGEFYAEAFQHLHDRLTASGYDHYEIANYARPGRACRHNLGYWRRQPYLGIGAGAHSFRSAGWGERWAVPAGLDGYAAALREDREPAECLERFDRQGAMSETLYLGLRTREGVNDGRFREAFARSLAESYPGAPAKLAPWLLQEADSWRLNVAGWLLYDRLIQEFL